MSASLNAVPGFKYNSVRDASDVTSRRGNDSRSNGNRDTFSQVIRRTSDEQRSSAPNTSRESDKKDKKAAKSDSDPAVTVDGNTRSEKSSLPITFLLGLPSEQLQGFDTQQ